MQCTSTVKLTTRRTVAKYQDVCTFDFFFDCPNPTVPRSTALLVRVYCTSSTTDSCSISARGFLRRLFSALANLSVSRLTALRSKLLLIRSSRLGRRPIRSPSSLSASMINVAGLKIQTSVSNENNGRGMQRRYSTRPSNQSPGCARKSRTPQYQARSK